MMHIQLDSDETRTSLRRFLLIWKWVAFSILVGILTGLIGSAFSIALYNITQFRLAHSWMIFFLPLCGIGVVLTYRLFGIQRDEGTNLVISAIQSTKEVPGSMAPIIFITTLLTHLGGGSAGREGAALQMGGSIGSTVGKLFRFDSKNKKILIMCGMAGVFSALFGTPMSATIFSMELISVGVMYYAALLPSAISSLIAYQIAKYLGVKHELFILSNIPNFTWKTALIIILLTFLAALVGILFCSSLKLSSHLFRTYIPTPYLRVLLSAGIIILLTQIIGNQDYNGTGIHIIQRAMEGKVVLPAFFLKILFTAITIGAGFKGGEIVPSLFIGSTFGCAFGTVIGFDPVLSAAVGLIAVFCGVTNCPITSLLIGFEMFGFAAVPYFLISVAFSYVFSGYSGLYKSQKILYSKYRQVYVDRHSQ